MARFTYTRVSATIRFYLRCRMKRQPLLKMMHHCLLFSSPILSILLAYGFGIDKAKHWILSTLRSTVTHKDVVLFFAGRKS